MTHYQIDVMAASVADLVEHAGGWLFDRTMAGWSVTALVDARHDDRPLRVLGVKAVGLDAALTAAPRSSAALAVTTALYLDDERVRHRVHAALNLGWPEVSVWGDCLPGALGQWVIPHRHELSSAARIFKANALAAADLPCEVDAAEAYGGSVHRATLPSLLNDVLPCREPATECGHEPPRVVRDVSLRRHRHD